MIRTAPIGTTPPKRAKATRQIIDASGNRRTVPAWQGQPTPLTGGLADWLAARRNLDGRGHA